MSWGANLWDQFDNVAAHTSKGYDFCERFSQFVKEWCAIENEYSVRLKKMVKNYQPKKKGEESRFTYEAGFHILLDEIFDFAGQHDAVAEKLNNHVIKDLYCLVQDGRQERKKILQEGNKQQQILQNQLNILEKAKSKYERLYREAEKSNEAYKKAEQDQHMSRADQDKAKQQWQAKTQSCEESKSEYAFEVQKAKEVQNDHYENAMPKVFTSLEELDEKRIVKLKEMIATTASIEREVMPIIGKCIEGMIRASDCVNAKQDLNTVADKYKTGFVPPNDIPFEDLSNGMSGSHTSLASSGKTYGRADGSVASSSKIATVSVKSKKRTGLFGIFGGQKKEEEVEDFSHLPPSQQKKQLLQKLDSLKANLAKEINERDGLVKMQDVYKSNPEMGNPASLEKGLEESAQKLDRLRQEISKFENYLSEADNRLQAGGDLSVTPTPSPSSQRRSTGAEHTTQPHSTSASTQPAGSASHGPPRPPAPFSVQQDSFEGDDEEFVDGETCTALYGFDATTEGSVSMAAGEKLLVLGLDQGDGWTHVRKLKCSPDDSCVEGFVPTSYIQLS